MRDRRFWTSPSLLLALLVWAVWAVAMFHGQRWHLFLEKGFMSVTMLLGSFVAGATSEGGGAVAFPVMTLIFGIEPPVARDFSLLIQSVGMTAASIAIFHMRTPIDRRALVVAGIGGAFGVIISLEWLAPILPGAYAKILFTSLWLSFAGALWQCNRDRERAIRSRITSLGMREVALFSAVGVLGGLVSGVLGSGLDILTFSLLVLGFRVSEAVATPTSVVLMASNALVGSLWKAGPGGSLSAEAWAYWWVCVPVVVVGAPVGAWFIRHRSRTTIANLLIASIVIQYVGALLILPLTPRLLVFSAVTVVLGGLVFTTMARVGAGASRRSTPA
jgi:uncharacterized membrane protein YfcA